MSVWSLAPDSTVDQAMKNCSIGFNEIVNINNPIYKSYFDFSIGSLHYYDKFLDGYLQGTHDKLIHVKLGFILLGYYLGEVIIRNLGGKWAILSEVTSVSKGFEPLVFINSGNQYFINPISEVAWKTKFGSRISLLKYFLSLKEEMTLLDRMNFDSHPIFNHMFHERNLDHIFNYRESEADELGYYVNYLTIPISEMND